MSPLTLASEVSSLFVLPDLALRVCAVMDSPSGSAQDLVEVIELDAGLAATVLRLANSALYGHGRVETLSHAVAMIGHKALRDLVLATSAVRAFKDIPEGVVDMDVFWENSITCAVLSQQIARRLKLQEAEVLFLAGLLHGVGRLVFYARRPREYLAVLDKAKGNPAALVEAERQAFGFDYAELGAALMEQWRLPKKLRTAVAHHMDPASATAYQQEVAVVCLASDMATHLAPGLKTHLESTAYIPGETAQASMDALGLTARDLDEISLDTLALSMEVIEIIHPGATTIF